MDIVKNVCRLPIKCKADTDNKKLHFQINVKFYPGDVKALVASIGINKATRDYLGYLWMSPSPMMHLGVWYEEHMGQETWKINLKDHGEKRLKHCYTNIKATH